MLYKILSVSSPAYLPQSFLYEQKYQYIANGSLFKLLHGHFFVANSMIPLPLKITKNHQKSKKFIKGILNLQF
jgi:hypothetical protein